MNTKIAIFSVISILGVFSSAYGSSLGESKPSDNPYIQSQPKQSEKAVEVSKVKIEPEKVVEKPVVVDELEFIDQERIKKCQELLDKSKQKMEAYYNESVLPLLKTKRELEDKEKSASVFQKPVHIEDFREYSRIMSISTNKKQETLKFVKDIHEQISKLYLESMRDFGKKQEEKRNKITFEQQLTKKGKEDWYNTFTENNTELDEILKIAMENQYFIKILDGSLEAEQNGGSGRVYVRGYTRKDGTYVSPHTRSLPRR